MDCNVIFDQCHERFVNVLNMVHCNKSPCTFLKKICLCQHKLFNKTVFFSEKDEFTPTNFKGPCEFELNFFLT